MTGAVSIKKRTNEALSRGIEQTLQRRDFGGLEQTLKMADEAKVPIKLRLKGWLALADESEQKKSMLKALLHLNSARRVSLSNVTVAQRIMNTAVKFYAQINKDCSREDVIRYQAAIGQIVSSYQSRGIDVSLGEELIKRLDYEIPLHNSKEETPASPAVNSFFNSVREGMTQQEVFDDLARLLAPNAIELIEKNEELLKKEKKKPGKRGILPRKRKKK
jgi:hypothetical protein